MSSDKPFESLNEDFLSPSFNVDDLLRDNDFSTNFVQDANGYLAPESQYIWPTDTSAPVNLVFPSFKPSSYDTGEEAHWYDSFNSQMLIQTDFNSLNGTTTSQDLECSEPNTWPCDAMSSVDVAYNHLPVTCEKGNSASCVENVGSSYHRWEETFSSTPNIYDPFKSGAMIEDLDSVQLGVNDYVGRMSLKRSQSTITQRPTFADIAKRPTSTGSESPSSSGLSRDGPVYESQESLASQPGKRNKQKGFRAAHARHSGGYSVPLPIQPDSKYGLDEFAVPYRTVPDSSIYSCCPTSKMERSLSCNDALSNKTLNVSNDTVDSLEVKLDHSSGDASNSVSSSTSRVNNSDWFDPKRIFQNGKVRNRSGSEPCEPILNNNFVRPGKGSERRSKASYINNLHDGGGLRTTSKQINQDRQPTMNGVSNGTNIPSATYMDHAESNNTCNGVHDIKGASSGSNHLPSGGNHLASTINLGKSISLQIFQYLLLTLIFVAGIIGQVIYFVIKNVYVMATFTFKYLAVKVGLNGQSAGVEGFSPINHEGELVTIGLQENILLPDTSEEAMRRLLTCQHKDAYSILGLRSDAADEDIKRYYRRQAVLIHPDKNQHPGAEEAFKILGQAFELVGTPEKRQLYDKKVVEEKLSEDVVHKLNEFLIKFKEKMEEASNWIQCNHCGEKHRRYLTDKPLSKARKCNRCQCNHAVKEGDMWAETTFMGFKWHFYACMENKVYDVTPWVSCQPSMADKFQPNAHVVRLKMSLSSGNSNKASSKHHSSNSTTSPSSREAELENLLKNVFSNHTSNNPFPTSHHPDISRQGADNSKPNSNSGISRKGKRRVRRR